MSPKNQKNRPLCPVSRVQNGIEYRCGKFVGHELELGNEECVAQAAEYMQKPESMMNDWRGLVMQSRPLLEWMAANERVVGLEHASSAQRVLVRVYMLSSGKPGLVKTTAL